MTLAKNERREVRSAVELSNSFWLEVADNATSCINYIPYLLYDDLLFYLS